MDCARFRQIIRRTQSERLGQSLVQPFRMAEHACRILQKNEGNPILEQIQRKVKVCARHVYAGEGRNGVRDRHLVAPGGVLQDLLLPAMGDVQIRK